MKTNNFENLIKFNLLFGSMILISPKTCWEPDFLTKIEYEFNFIKVLKLFFKNYKKFKNEFDMKSCNKVYDLLQDEYSKEMYIKVLMRCFFLDSRLRFPHEFEFVLTNYLCKYDYLIVDDTNIVVPNGELKKYDLSKLNKNFKIIYGNKLAFYYEFIKEQYNYRNFIFPREGDVVIDGGGCYGETALSFIDKMNGNGNIFSFEITDKNLEIFRQNLDLNLHYKNNIKIIEYAISDKDGFAYIENYQASATSLEENYTENSKQIKTISIDKFVSDFNLNKVNFIKLDIEGFEQKAINGAINTISKFKPTLAICIYHKKKDLWEIPLLINKYFPKYKFYIEHYSLNTEETVLFGVYNNDN